MSTSRKPHFNTTHGLSQTRIYDVWKQMLRRCYNPNCKDFKNYGGRGISVCDEWLDIHGFVSWANKSGYRPKVTIERRDVNQGYSPDNCSWIENERQALNTTRSRFITHNGETLHISDWARRTGINCRTLKGRLNRGWDAELMLTLPAKSGRNHLNGAVLGATSVPTKAS